MQLFRDAQNCYKQIKKAAKKKNTDTGDKLFQTGSYSGTHKIVTNTYRRQKKKNTGDKLFQTGSYSGKQKLVTNRYRRQTDTADRKMKKNTESRQRKTK
jgi:hypothetical protein